MCRALQVVCVASDEPSLEELKRVAVATEWELTPGATDAETVLAQIEERRAHVLVAWGSFGDLVARTRERFPALRVISVGPDPVPEADVNISSIEDVRDAILGIPPRGGPVRS